MDLTNPKIIIEQLGQARLRTKKYLGQHFLASSKILDQIVKSAKLSNDDVVLEVGPGLGVLTVELAARANSVFAVEKDKSLISLLSQNLQEANLGSKVIISNEDILKFDVSQLPQQYKLVANLPYQVTSAVLWKFLHESESKPSHMVIMIQEEVADRLLARPGDMSLLSVLAQYYGQVRKVASVKRTQFFPPPQVASAVVSINSINARDGVNEQIFFKLAKAGFASKRKKLKNNLQALDFTAPALNQSLLAAGLPESARAQELSVDDWLKLYKVLYNK